MERKISKNGFTLIEIIVAVAILAVLAAVLAPSFFSSMLDSKEKVDAAAIENLQTTIQTSFQSSNYYKNARKIANATYDNSIMVIYQMNDDNVLEMQELRVNDRTYGVVTDATQNDVGEKLSELRDGVEGYINGQIEPIEIQSEKYIEKENFCYYISFPDVDFKVDVEVTAGLQSASINQQHTILGSTSAFGSYSTANGVLTLMPGGKVHTHTGIGGLAQNSIGDTWKIVITGENLEEFELYDTTYNVKSASTGWKHFDGGDKTEIKTGNSYVLYFTTPVDYPYIAFCFKNSGANDSVIESIQFSKVES